MSGRRGATKTKKVNRGYRGSTMLGHTRTKTKTVSAGRAKRIKRRYSK